MRTETAKVTNWGYRCASDSCPPTIYRSAFADSFALKGYNFALDVIVFIGQERLNQHRNLKEIHSTLLSRWVQISSRRISDFFTIYELLLSTTHVDKLRGRRELIIEAGGVRLAIDGIQPQGGKEILYIFRDATRYERFAAVSLAHHDQKSLAREMEKVAKLLDSLELPLRSIITDHQPGLISACAEVWQDVPHQFCQLHSQEALAKPIGRQYSNLATKLKKKLRPLREIERELAEEQVSLRQSKSEPDQEQALKLATVSAPTPSQAVCSSSPVQTPTLPFSSRPLLTDISHKSPLLSAEEPSPEISKATVSEIVITSPGSSTSPLNRQVNLAPAPDLTGSGEAPLLASVSDEHLTTLPAPLAADVFVQLAEPAHEEYFLADRLLPQGIRICELE